MNIIVSLFTCFLLNKYRAKYSRPGLIPLDKTLLPVLSTAPSVCLSFYDIGKLPNSQLVLWRTYGECENFAVLSGHKAAILDLAWSRDDQTIYSASADSHLASWDAVTGLRIRRFVGHEDIVNCLDITKRGPEVIMSGSDDGSIGVRF